MTISWLPKQGVTKYTVENRLPDSTKWSQSGFANQPNFTAKSLEPDTEYHFRVKVTNDYADYETQTPVRTKAAVKPLTLFKALPPEVTASPGDNVTLEAEVDSKATSIRWSKDGVYLTSPSTTNTDTSTELKIVKVKDDDFGKYTCTFENQAGAVFTECLLTRKKTAKSKTK